MNTQFRRLHVAHKRNAQLYRYYHATVPVQRLDVTTPQGMDAVFNPLADSTGRVVIDTPAQFGDALERLIQELPLGEILDTLHARITVVFVLSRVKDSIQALKSALTTLQGLPVDWVIVKNGHFGKPDDFSRYDSSKTREEVQQAGGIELYLPDLQDVIYDGWMRKTGLSRASRRRTAGSSWKNNGYTSG